VKSTGTAPIRPNYATSFAESTIAAPASAKLPECRPPKSLHARRASLFEARYMILATRAIVCGTRTVQKMDGAGARSFKRDVLCD